MTQIDRQVRQAHTRITLNILFEQLAVGLLIGAAVFGMLLLVDRIFAFTVPFQIIAYAPLALFIGVSVIGALLRKESRLTAAVALDQAAGLKERISTAVALAGSPDPFVRAAIADANQAAGGVRVGAAIPLRLPKLLPWSISSALAAALLFWLMPELNLFAATQKEDTDEQALQAKVEAKNVNVAVQAKINEIEERSKHDPMLKDLVEDLKPLALPENATKTPDDVRREAVKRIDNVAEKLAEKKDAVNPEALNELKRQLSQLEQPKPDSSTSKLTEALSKGDMNEAAKAASEIKKQIEDAAQKGDEESKQRLEEMAQKMENLAQQLAKLADEQKMQKELENKAGMNEQQAKELLKQLQNMDPKQLQQELQKQLTNSGMKQEEIKQLAQKMSQQKDAMEQMKQMANALSKCASACEKSSQGQNSNSSQGAAAEAAQAMADAQQQISDMEMAEQTLNEIDAQLNDLKNMRNGVCKGDFGKGSGDQGDEIGDQGPDAGRGYGSKVGKKTTAHQYQPSKVNANTGRGEIIGRMLVDGPQAKGEATAETSEAVIAAVRDATDAIERQRAPRQYEHVLRAYFESLAGLAPANGATGDMPAKKEAAPANAADKVDD